MDQDPSSLLNLELLDNRRRLQSVLAQISTQEALAPDVIEAGLIAAHTVKALAAVRGIAHLEAFAAQLEQVFQRVGQMGQGDFLKHFKPDIQRIQAEFDAACSAVEATENNPPQPHAKRLDRLVETLYNLDRHRKDMAYETHLSQLQAHEVSMESLFRGFVPWLHQAARTEGKSLQVEMDIAQPIAISSEWAETLQTVLVHLLRNALYHGIESEAARKYSGKAPTGTLWMTSTREDDEIIMTIDDDGRGIPELDDGGLPRIQRHLFDAAHQEPETAIASETGSAIETSIFATENRQTGLGIGLHIVKTRLQQLGGNLELKSIPGLGTSAIVRIPLYALGA